MNDVSSLVDGFTSRLAALIESQTLKRARQAVESALGGRGPGRPPKLGKVAFSGKPRKKPPIQLCPVPGCKNRAAPVFGTYDGNEVQAFPNFYSGSTFAGFEELFTAPMMDLPYYDTDFLSQYIWDLQSGAQLRILPAPLYSGATGSFFALPGDGGQLLTVDRGAAEIWCR